MVSPLVVTCPHCGGVFEMPTDITVREIEILEHAAKGESNEVIARKLDISAQTVKNHMTHAMLKMQAQNRTQAVVIAIKQGLIKV